MSTAYHNNQLFINGEWVNPSSNEVLPVINPATEEVIGTVGRANAEDINKAVASARAAFNGWSSKTGAERAVFLRKIADLVKEEKKNLARFESIDMGKPLPETEWDMDDVAGTFEYYADKAEELDRRQNTPVEVPHDSFSCKLRYEAVGVVGLIVPWNYPLLMAAWKVAPALGAGCTVVLKPSEWSCLTALELADIVAKAGIPKGVFNVVPGYGYDAGDALTNHEDVDAIAFTGSTKTGSNVMKSAANTLKNVSLELGGKGALIIFDDVDIEQAVEWIMFGVFWSNGQICSATSRVLIHSKIYDAVLRRLKEEAEKVVIGDPLQEGVKLGPLVSRQQYEKVTGYVEQGVRDGARLLTGGKRPDNLPRGFYLQPTVFVDVKDWMSIWREEIFGPVVCIVPFENEDEAIHIANDSPYGLGAAVMSKDLDRADRVVRGLRFGVVWVNCSQPCFTHAPWGGFKRSGVGRDLGQYGFDRFLEVKQVTTYTTINEPWAWYIAKL